MIDTATIIRGGLILVALLIVTACHRQSGRSGQSSPFPESNEIADWVRIGEIRTFPAHDLWKYIDGEAERYLKAGVQTASTADYRFQGKFDAVVDIYAMATTADATQLFESEPAGDAERPKLADGARLYSTSLVFRKASYVVRITAYQDSTELQPALLGLGRAVDERLSK